MMMQAPETKVSPQPKNTRRRLLFCLSIAALLLIALGISLGVYFGVRSSPEEPTQPTAPPVHVVPTAAPSSTRQAQLLALLSPLSSLLDDDSSPQSLAFDWLLSDVYSEALSNDRLIQRFALATLWFSTNGTHWEHGGWLERRDECLWGEVVDDEDFADEVDISCSSNNNVVLQLSLCCTSLQGELPPEVGLLTGLTSLILGSNLLTGNAPTELGNLGNLTRLILDNNQFQGPIPTDLARLTNLGSLYLDNNQFSSSIPSQLADLTSLRALFLKNNRLSGSIPTELGLLSNLVWFPLHINELTGPIPTEFGQLTLCTTLSLFDNQLSESLPSELGHLTRLVYFSVAQNRLSGAIPTQIELLTLSALYLEDNELTGSLPASLCDNLTFKNTLWIDCDEVECDCCANGNGEVCEATDGE